MLEPEDGQTVEKGDYLPDTKDRDLERKRSNKQLRTNEEYWEKNRGV